MQIVATRKFWNKSELVQIGARLELPEADALALITAGKAEAATAVAVPAQPTEEKEIDHASETTKADEAEGVEDVQGVD
jgi:hypothetical protein